MVNLRDLVSKPSFSAGVEVKQKIHLTAPVHRSFSVGVKAPGRYDPRRFPIHYSQVTIHDSRLSPYFIAHATAPITNCVPGAFRISAPQDSRVAPVVITSSTSKMVLCCRLSGLVNR